MSEIVYQVLAATVGTIAFSVLFGVPRKYYPYCGLIGGAGWLVYAVLLLVSWIEETEAIFFATVLVILLSRVFAVWERCPVTIFLTTGIFPLVPGAGLYWTTYYIVTDQLELASQRGFMALKAVVSIVLGIVFVFELPQKIFSSMDFQWLRERRKTDFK